MINVVLCIVGLGIVAAGIIFEVVKQAKEHERAEYQWHTAEDNNKTPKRSKGITTCVVLFGFLMFLFSQCFVFVNSGNTGVRITFGQVSEETVTNGFNWKVPFVQAIETIDNKLQDFMTAYQDGDIIESTVEGKIPINVRDITVSYNINPMKSAYIYLTVTDMRNLLTKNIISSAVKSVTPNYTPEHVVQRIGVETEMVAVLQKYADEKYGQDVLLIRQVTIGDIGFTEEYNRAVEEKNKAAQTAEKQKIENQTRIEAAKANVMVATEEAEAKKIAAQGEKDANDLLEKSLTSAILTSMWLERWDGKMPIVTGDSGNMLDISSIIPETQAEDKTNKE